MSSPVDVQLHDRLNNIILTDIVGQSDFDSHIIALSFSITMQPSLLLGIRTKVIISSMRRRL